MNYVWPVFGQPPIYTSLKRFDSNIAFDNTAFHTGWDIGVNWKE